MRERQEERAMLHIFIIKWIMNFAVSNSECKLQDQYNTQF